MTTIDGSGSSPRFLDMQAAVGITKHIGGLAATNDLLSLCHVEHARDVLYVGCGIGVGPAHIARRHKCRVVGIDISEQMIAWARRRVREAGVAAQVTLLTADVLNLPFAPACFDAVICESVLVFVPDKVRAIRECVQVTRPGGFFGINEAFWFRRPAHEVEALVKDAVGPTVPTLEEWDSLWQASGLCDRVVRAQRIDARGEVKSRIQWIGWPWLVRAWGRALHLYLTNPAQRAAIKSQFDVPKEVLQEVGFVLLAGRK